MSAITRSRLCRSIPAALMAAIAAKEPVSGHTHNFYLYPARFSPLFVSEVIRHYSRRGDVILDPFMGGGTSVVEALSLGRKIIGVDLNTLAHFVSTTKTTPLSPRDVELLRQWIEVVRKNDYTGTFQDDTHVHNLPCYLQRLWTDLIAQIKRLPLKRQRSFVRSVLLRTGQWAVDCKKGLPSRATVLRQFMDFFDQMLDALNEFICFCSCNGVTRNEIQDNRLLLCRSTAGLEDEPRLARFPKPKLVITSPPYPAVHILYHRWQVHGRRETPAPYWLAALKDGHSASHYTFGSRSILGLENYFRSVHECFHSVRKVIARDALIVQLVAFSDAGSQLPSYLDAMKAAGFVEVFPAHSRSARIWRNVPNRKWYANITTRQDASREVVLFHRPD